MPAALCVFDAYGTLFDVTASARDAAGTFPALASVWPKLADDWRRKQLEYTWQLAITGPHADFGIVTANALDWAMAANSLPPDPDLRADLLARYDRLPAFQDVGACLAALAAAGIPCAILSNGTPAMLAELVGTAGITRHFEALLSVEDAGVFKPDARVYALVGTRFGTVPADVLFLSANGWDISGAAGYGFRTAWINRAGLPVDRLPNQPGHILPDLGGVPALALR
jgi:2-haloacid dehalogenase